MCDFNNFSVLSYVLDYSLLNGDGPRDKFLTLKKATTQHLDGGKSVFQDPRFGPNKGLYENKHSLFSGKAHRNH